MYISLLRPRALIFFILGWPGASILDAVGLLFGFRDPLGLSLLHRWCPLKVAEKKPAPQYCIAGTLWWKIIQKGVPKVCLPLTVSGAFGDLILRGIPLDAKNRAPVMQHGKYCTGGTKLHRRYHFVSDMQSQRLLTKTLPSKQLPKGSTIPHQLARGCTGLPAQ